MDTGQAEYHVLRVLVYTFCFSIIVGLIGVWAGKVDAQFVEGLITGGLLTLITNVFKDLSVKNGGSNVSSNQAVLPQTIQEPGAPKV